MILYFVSADGCEVFLGTFYFSKFCFSEVISICRAFSFCNEVDVLYQVVVGENNSPVRVVFSHRRWDKEAPWEFDIDNNSFCFFQFFGKFTLYT